MQFTSVTYGILSASLCEMKYLFTCQRVPGLCFLLLVENALSIN